MIFSKIGAYSMVPMYTLLHIMWLAVSLANGGDVRKIVQDLNQFLGIQETDVIGLRAPTIEDIRDHVRFQVFTRRNGPEGVHLRLDPLSLKRSKMLASKPVRILIHGFLGRLRDGWMSVAKDALQRREDSNVVLIGWTNITQILLYPWVVEQSYGVARYVTELIDFLVEHGFSSKNMHIIGHSVGAHIAGVASKDAAHGVVGRITGLDAAYPLYKGLRESDRLDGSDADYVDCIHTSSGILGIPEPFCDADFYPNGGTLYQPGCNPFTLVICSHLRSRDYFIESIYAEHIFKAFTCYSSFLAFLDCADRGAVMGYPSTRDLNGVFYVPTDDHYPYSGPNPGFVKVPAPFLRTQQ